MTPFQTQVGRRSSGGRGVGGLEGTFKDIQGVFIDAFFCGHLVSGNDPQLSMEITSIPILNSVF